MIAYPLHNLKMSRDDLRALYTFLESLEGVKTENVYESLHLMALSRILRKRVWPKLAEQRKEYMLRINGEDSLILFQAFIRYGFAHIAPEWHPNLYGIRNKFWTIDTTYRERITPPSQKNKDG